MTLTRQALVAARALLALTLVLGVAYPLVITAAALAMPDQARGSLVTHRGQTVGSSLLGQKFTGAQWFQPRPSDSDYAGDTSGGSNLGQRDPAQKKAIADRTAALRAANPQATGVIPADAVTASSSGLDPDISVAYAQWQIPRVAAARHLSVQELQALVRTHTTDAPLGFLGQPRVNVLELNVALNDLNGH